MPTPRLIPGRLGTWPRKPSTRRAWPGHGPQNRLEIYNAPKRAWRAFFAHDDVLFLSMIIQFVETACFAAIRGVRLLFGMEHPDCTAFHPTDWAREIASILRPIHFQAPVREIGGLESFRHLSQAFVGFGDLGSQGFSVVRLGERLFLRAKSEFFGKPLHHSLPDLPRLGVEIGVARNRTIGRKD